MTLKLHNTLTGKLDTFTPISDNKVSLYTCGPTVYNYLHVGNWAAYVYWDTLVRTLTANDYNVERVMNITDVGHLTSDADDGEDKLEKGARREGKTAWDVAKLYGDDFIAGMDKLNLITPQHITKATDYIPQQLDLVRTLQQKGHTYQIDDGIYFDTSTFPAYADFAHLDLAAQKAGARVEFNTEKRNPSDFALWKFTPAGEKRDMEWETPKDLIDPSPLTTHGEMMAETTDGFNKDIYRSSAVMGFPGWHLECSAMAMAILGSTIDIHTGGIDHIPVHHTNEIAQSESASGQPFAHYWIHNNHLKVDGTKISKSLGNGFTLQDLAEQGYDPLDYRMFILQGQYSNEGNFTFDNLTAAKNRRHNWRNIAALRHQTHDTIIDDSAKLDDDKTLSLHALPGALREALNNNLNTPEALRLVDHAFNQLASAPIDRIHRHSLVHALQAIDDMLGLDLLGTTPDISDDTKQLILQRQHARANHDWALSDTLRDQLVAAGIIIRDSANNSTWEYAPAA